MYGNSSQQRSYPRQDQGYPPNNYNNNQQHYNQPQRVSQPRSHGGSYAGTPQPGYSSYYPEQQATPQYTPSPYSTGGLGTPGPIGNHTPGYTPHSPTPQTGNPTYSPTSPQYEPGFNTLPQYATPTPYTPGHTPEPDSRGQIPNYSPSDRGYSGGVAPGTPGGYTPTPGYTPSIQRYNPGRQSYTPGTIGTPGPTPGTPGRGYTPVFTPGSHSFTPNSGAHTPGPYTPHTPGAYDRSAGTPCYTPSYGATPRDDGPVSEDVNSRTEGLGTEGSVGTPIYSPSGAPSPGPFSGTNTTRRSRRFTSHTHDDVMSPTPSSMVMSPITVYSPTPTPGDGATPTPYTPDENGQYRNRKRTRGEEQTGGRKKGKTSDIFHNTEDVTDFICDFRFKNQVFSFSSCPRFVSDNVKHTELIKDGKKHNLSPQGDLIFNENFAFEGMIKDVLGSSANNQTGGKNIHLRPDDNTVKAEDVKVLTLQEAKKAQHIAAKEALFLRRGLLTSNDLYSEGLSFKHGIEGAEKAVIREAESDYELTPERLKERVENMFVNVKTDPVHPTKRKMKIKRTLAFVPNKELWAHPYAQVKFDEAPAIDLEVPSIMSKVSPSNLLTGFGVYQYSRGTGVHSLTKSYQWDNQKEYLENDKHDDFLLVEWPSNKTKPDVMFSKIGNKLHLKKLTAKIQARRVDFEQKIFGQTSLKVQWRDPTDNEIDEDAIQSACLIDENYLHSKYPDQSDTKSVISSATKQTKRTNLSKITRSSVVKTQ